MSFPCTLFPRDAQEKSTRLLLPEKLKTFGQGSYHHEHARRASYRQRDGKGAHVLTRLSFDATHDDLALGCLAQSF